MHYCARFVTCPKRDHGSAVKHIGRYLRVTGSKGTILRPDKEKILEVFCDTDFAGNLDPKESEDRGTAIA